MDNRKRGGSFKCLQNLIPSFILGPYLKTQAPFRIEGVVLAQENYLPTFKKEIGSK